MLTIGLTGGIGSGKTSVSNLFESLGVHIIDTDVIARELLKNDPAVLQEVIENFGQKILSTNGQLDRKKLAQIVFAKTEDKQRLEKILHPKIRQQVRRQLQSVSPSNSTPGYVIIVIPLLLETDFSELVDRTLIVMAGEKLRINRVRERDNRNVNEIEAIISHQVSDQIRLQQADDIINNNNNFKELESQVKQLHKKYLSLSKSVR